MGSVSRTLVPIRAVFEAMGYEVSWSPGGYVALSRFNDEIEFNVTATIVNASSLVRVNGEYVPLGFPTMLVGHRTMARMCNLLTHLGHLVDWDVADDALTMHITSLMGSVSWDFTPGALHNQMALPEPDEEFAIIHTNLGEIHLRLFANAAPLAVENFVAHAMGGYYDGLLFHRVIDNFVIQSGCPQGDGQGGESIWGAPFGNETTPNLRHIRGALSAANTGPNSNRSQFFIVQGENLYYRFVQELEEALATQDDLAAGDTHTLGELFPSEFEFIQHYLEYGGWPHLDFGHTVFGQVFYGMDVVDAIAAMQTDADDKPIEEIIIESIEILTAS